MQGNVEYKILKEEYENMEVFEIFKNALILVYQNIKIVIPYVVSTCIGILAFIFIIPILLFLNATKFDIMSATNLMSLACLLIASLLYIFAFWKTLEANLITIRCSSKLLRGEDFDIKTEGEMIRPKMFGYLVLNLVMGLIMIIFYTFCFMLGIAMTFNPIVMGIIAATVCALFTVFYTLNVVFAHQIYALNNNIDGIEAIIESFKLVQAKKLMGPVFVMGIFIWLIATAVNVGFGIVPVIGAIFAYLVNAIVLPAVLQMAYTHLYLQSFVKKQEQI